MEYRGVRYTIRIGIERQQWRVALHPPGNEFPKEKTVLGTREQAEHEAHSMVDAWLQRQSARTKKTKTLVEQRNAN